MKTPMTSLAKSTLLMAGALAMLPAALHAADTRPKPVLLVVANTDFYAPDYFPLRSALEAEGLTVRVAATTLATAVPHGGNPAETVRPDVELTSVQAADYSAIAFVGGWGASSYQYAFQGTYANAAYRPDRLTSEAVNRVIGDLLAENKPVAAICHGTTVLAWARVDGTSPLSGRTVTGYPWGGPGFRMRGVDYADGAISTRWHVETNGAVMVPSESIGDPATAADDVIVDGRIITAQDFSSAPAFGRAIASEVKRALSPAPKRVLMVIANQDFWYREYAEPRAALETAGVIVDVAAAEAVPSFPHADSGYTDGSGVVTPDLSIADALALAASDPERYRAIVFVGGWGASSYQYAYGGTYQNASYNGSLALRENVADLIGLFVSRGRFVTALCHGVSVLAYARVNGQPLLRGHTVVAWPGYAPAEVGPNGGNVQRLTRSHIESQGATMLPTNSVGDPWSAADDVVVDGRVITGESFDSAREFGVVLARELLAE